MTDTNQAENFNSIKSTSGSPTSEKPTQVRKMPKDLGNYVDFDSPIQQHLIEIERKFWHSEVNQDFKFPRKVQDDSEYSIESLHEVCIYDQTEQNHKLPKKPHSLTRPKPSKESLLPANQSFKNDSL